MHRARLGKRGRTIGVSSVICIALLLSVSAALFCILSACSSSEGKDAPSGGIVSADGVVLAETAGDSGKRVYPEGKNASVVVGSCYTEDAPEGIEQRYERELLDGEDIELTLDTRIQRAAMDALGDRLGAIVVMDPETGAVLAMASSPAYDPNSPSAGDQAQANHATELHVPGSTFKTVTLAAALESGRTSINTRYPVLGELVFEDGVVSNYGATYDAEITLEQAYAQSVNTVFAQIALQVGIDRIEEMAGRFGFGGQIMDDFPLETSVVLDMESSSDLVKAWAGVGQAVYGDDGVLRGPVMTCVQGALVAATICNGGTVFKPYLVSKVGERQTASSESPVVLAKSILPSRSIDYIGNCMRAVVEEGTGKGAEVPGVEVCGKTGTAETASGEDDGWFIGFTRQRGGYAFAVLVEGAASSDAVDVARNLIASI